MLGANVSMRRDHDLVDRFSVEKCWMAHPGVVLMCAVFAYLGHAAAAGTQAVPLTEAAAKWV